MQPSLTGVILDPRDDYEKSKDYLHEEVASGEVKPVWEERPFKARYYSPYNQASSLSCVAGGGAVTLEYFYGDFMSRKDIYIRRVNYPSGGMFLNDVFEICMKGVSTDAYVPSQALGEVSMNTRYPITSDIIKSRAAHPLKAFFNIKNCNDIDTLASILQDKNATPIVAFWYFDEAGTEWWRPEPTVKFNFTGYTDPRVTRHQVVLVDAVLVDGKKYIVGQDTAGVGSGYGADGNLRLISEEMISKRLYAAGYGVADVKPIDTSLDPRPKYKNNSNLEVGSTGPAVVMLQNILIYEGFLKIKKPTGVFAGLTRAAVIKLQEKYAKDILTPVGLKKGTGYVGSSTNKFLNNLYN